MPVSLSKDLRKYILAKFGRMDMIAHKYPINITQYIDVIIQKMFFVFSFVHYLHYLRFCKNKVYGVV